jgi:hypothetical protein
MYFFSRLLNNATMKTIEQIHRLNLAVLVVEYGSVTGAADAAGCSPSQFSQWLNASENSGTGKPRGLNASSCRKIEVACGKPVGWMDVEHEPITTTVATPDMRTEPSLVAPPWMDAEAFMLLNLFYDLDVRRRHSVMDYIKSQTPSVKGAAGVNEG